VGLSFAARKTQDWHLRFIHLFGEGPHPGPQLLGISNVEKRLLSLWLSEYENGRRCCKVEQVRPRTAMEKLLMEMAGRAEQLCHRHILPKVVRPISTAFAS
jgi:hypothetical protein